MRILVCLKRVPDPQARLRPRPDGSGLADDGFAHIVNEGDECALEAAQGLRGAADAVEIVALTIGGEAAGEALRRALALGADRALRVDAPDPIAADPWCRARLIEAAVRQLDVGLLITGAQSTAFGSAVTGSLVAGLLGWPHVWLTVGIEAIDGKRLRVVREMESRRFEKSIVELPAALQVQLGIAPPRMVRIRDLLAAKKRPIEVLDGVELAGPLSPRQRLVELREPAPVAGCELIGGAPAQAAQTLLTRLRADGLLEGERP